MLLKNHVPELCIVNGSVGTVKKVMNKNRAGIREPGTLPAYATIDFPSINISKEKKCLPDAPRRTVPVSVNVFRNEKYCYMMDTFPLHVCKAISIHKYQGISAGPGKQWEMVVLILPRNKQMKIPE
eukprot:3186986-Ditylum_brightwellii.AAC.1